MNLDDAFERYMDELDAEPDLIPVPTKIRAIRRHHTDRVFIKTLKHRPQGGEFYWWRHNGIFERSDYKATKKRMNNRAMCSRQCCSKTRHAKWRGGNSVLAVTLQERRVRITLLEELNCPSWTEEDDAYSAYLLDDDRYYDDFYYDQIDCSDDEYFDPYIDWDDVEGTFLPWEDY